MHLRGADVEEEFPRFSHDKSVLKLLIDGLERNGNKVAQIEAASDKSYTFNDILRLSKSIAMGLRSIGIVHGDYVVICCRKCSIAYATQLGVMFAGAIPVLIDIKCASDVHKFTHGHIIKAVFSEKPLLHSLNQSLSQTSPKPTLIDLTDVNDTTMKLLLQASDEFSLFEIKDNRNVVLVLFTSGCTSDSKGVQISDLSLQRLGYSFVDEGIESYLQTGPFAWVSSTISLVSSIFKGYSLVLCEEKDPALHLKIIEKYRVNGWTVGSEDLYLYAKQTSLSTDLSSLTVINVGGGVVKKRTIETFVSKVLKGKTGIQLIYGMTEIGIITTWRNKDLLDLSKADSSGYLAPGVEVKITDEQGSLVEAGNVGEIRVKSLSMMVGYWGRPELDATVFDSDGFFRTDDTGYFDNDGFLYVVGRASDIVTHEGAKVSISEVVDLLKSHSAVLDAGVVAKLQPSFNHHLIAFITPRPGCQVQEEEVSLFIKEQAGRTIKLKGIHVVESIPRTHSGKVHRGLLHKMADEIHTPALDT